MEEKKKRGRPPNKRDSSEVSVGVKMIEAAQKKHLAPMTPEQEKTYQAMVTHGLGFLAHLGKLFILFGNPPDDYQI